MTNCPTCRAPYRSGSTCYRCGADLAAILAVQVEAAAFRRAATRALSHRALITAQGYADRALFLHRSKEALGTAALVALVRRDFKAACELWFESCQSAEAEHGETPSGPAGDQGERQD